ncbi:MAG: hypothetical protein M1821_005991 [Bathelium mastoideum]|nr:MAG: hypothetical protein M1821_005991 [Bathelium mastoideum]KAI9688472.1 MAG: hypothetical protein M1822_001421 [Bathelium mastoideum]
MSIIRYALPALALAGSALAQNCAAPTTTVQNSGDASALGGCPTYSGDIVIATGTTDNLDFGDLGEVKGSFTANNVTQITTITAGSLQTITDTFLLESLTVLTTLNFPKLNSVGTMTWQTLPALQGLNFGDPGLEFGGDVQISDTQLSTLNGINFMSVNTLTISENRYLNDIDLQLRHINTSLFLAGNGPSLNVSLPNLENAYNLTFINVTGLSFPALQSTNGSIGIQGSSMQTLSAPNVTYINQSLSFSDNEKLQNVSMPQLIQIGGGFTLARNPEYLNMDGFPDLKTVRGAVDINGNFTNVTLPALSDVEGAFNLQSTADISSDCSTFQAISGQSAPIKGKFTCAGSQTRPGGAGTSPSGTSSSSSATGAASALDISSGAVYGLTGVLAAMMGLF